MHLLPHAVAAVFRFDDRLVEKIREIINMSIRAKNHIATAPAVTAIRSALRHKFLAPKTDATAAALPRLCKNFDSIDEHRLIITRPRERNRRVARLCSFAEIDCKVGSLL